MRGPFTTEEDPVKKLFGFLKQTEKNALLFWGSGCLLGTFAIDLAETSPQIRGQVAQKFDDLSKKLSILFKPVGGPPGPTARELTDSYLTVLEGSIVMAKSFNEPDRIRKGLTLFRRQVEERLK